VEVSRRVFRSFVLARLTPQSDDSGPAPDEPKTPKAAQVRGRPGSAMYRLTEKGDGSAIDIIVQNGFRYLG
jgi:hypothetical protein